MNKLITASTVEISSLTKPQPEDWKNHRDWLASCQPQHQVPPEIMDKYFPPLPTDGRLGITPILQILETEEDPAYRLDCSLQDIAAALEFVRQFLIRHVHGNQWEAAEVSDNGQLNWMPITEKQAYNFAVKYLTLKRTALLSLCYYWKVEKLGGFADKLVISKNTTAILKQAKMIIFTEIDAEMEDNIALISEIAYPTGLTSSKVTLNQIMDELYRLHPELAHERGTQLENVRRKNLKLAVPLAFKNNCVRVLHAARVDGSQVVAIRGVALKVNMEEESPLQAKRQRGSCAETLRTLYGSGIKSEPTAVIENSQPSPSITPEPF